MAWGRRYGVVCCVDEERLLGGEQALPRAGEVPVGVEPEQCGHVCRTGDGVGFLLGSARAAGHALEGAGEVAGPLKVWVVDVVGGEFTCGP